MRCSYRACVLYIHIVHAHSIHIEYAHSVCIVIHMPWVCSVCIGVSCVIVMYTYHVSYMMTIYIRHYIYTYMVCSGCVCAHTPCFICMLSIFTMYAYSPVVWIYPYSEYACVWYVRTWHICVVWTYTHTTHTHIVKHQWLYDVYTHTY